MTTASVSQLGSVSAKNKTATQAVLDACAKNGIHLAQVFGVGGGDHADGYATDFMVYDNKAWGDWIANYLWTNRAALGVRWIIWQQRIISTTMPSNSYGPGGQWNPMPDRGSPTANHRDHVHVKWNVSPVQAVVNSVKQVITKVAQSVKSIPAPPRWVATNELLDDEHLRYGVRSDTASIFNPKLWSWLYWKGGDVGQAFCKSHYKAWMAESSSVFGPTTLAAVRQVYWILNYRDPTHWPASQTVNPLPTYPGPAFLKVLGFRAD